jgi:hypothetical protein
MAEQDLSTVLGGSGHAYLQARGRLGDHLTLAHEVALARLVALDERSAKLEGSGASGSDIERERGRVIAVLAEAKDPADAPRFAKQLRAVLDRPEAQEDWQVLLDPWRSLLLDLGPSAAASFATLVTDTHLTAAQREFFLHDLVAVTAREQLGTLCAQLGHGDRNLERALRRALVRRARSDEADRAELLASLEAQLADPESPPSRRSASLLLRERIGGLQSAHEAKLVSLATDTQEDFEVRAAALLAIGRDPVARPAIEELAAFNLEPSRRPEQASEILAWLALSSLPAASQARLTERFTLREAQSPRLAAIAWQSAELDPSADWLEDALAHPWPEVRREAVTRVGASCSTHARNRLRVLSGPQSKGGDADEQFARATLGALGRCGDVEGLRDLVEDDGIGFERRGSAARALVQHDPEGSEFVAQLLRGAIDPHLGMQFADAMASAPADSGSPRVIEALCHTEATNPSASAAAARSRKKLSATATCRQGD